MQLLQFCIYAVVGEFSLVLGCGMRCSLVWFVQYMVYIWCSRVPVNWSGRLKFNLLQFCVFTVIGVFGVVGEVYCSSCIFGLGVQYIMQLQFSVVCVVCYYVVKCSWCLFGVPYAYGVVLRCIAVGVCYCSCCCLLLAFMQFLQFRCMFLLQLMQFITVAAVVLCRFVYLRRQCCLISCCGSRCSLMWLLSEISVKRGAGTSPIQHLLFLTCLVNIA